MKRLFIACILTVSLGVTVNAQDRLGILDKQSRDKHPIHHESFFERMRDHWGDCEDKVGFGGTLTYVPDNIYGLSAHGYNSWFHCSLDLEFVTKSTEYDCNRGKGPYKDAFHILFSPGVNFFYCTADLGFGLLLGSVPGDSETIEVSTTTAHASTTFDYRAMAAPFILRPRFTVHIPLDENFQGPSIDLNIGYNYVPKLNDYPKLSFGIGFTYFLD